MRKTTNSILRQQYQLDAEKKELDKQIKQGEALFQHHREEIGNFIERNRVILKANELCLYNIKEQAIELLADYKKIEKITGAMLFGSYEMDQAMGYLQGISTKINNIERNFYETFRMSVEEYKVKRMAENNKCSLN